MIHVPEILSDLNVFSVTLRLLLAMLFGGIIGLERGANRHPAGFRTHILVCVGSALAMLTNQYIFEMWGSVTDPARIGAQVITGVGFLGAGTILFTGRNRIRGLTTAAGLWASECLGLAIGIGFYFGAVIGAVVVFISLALLPKIEAYFYEHSGVVNVYVELSNIGYFKNFFQQIKRNSLQVEYTNLNQPNPMTPGGVGFALSLRMDKKGKKDNEELVELISMIEGVTVVEEI
ncbi:MAG: MgtC/SapB family protein [Anaerovoracaceae bacterium]|jgi:putative Mg2+ transporter-C (MgtC) family protein